jgi:hypothetical protein
MSETDEGRVENCAIWIAQYIDSNGEMPYVVKQRGDVPLSTVVGLLELAKQDLIKTREA